MVGPVFWAAIFCHQALLVLASPWLPGLKCLGLFLVAMMFPFANMHTVSPAVFNSPAITVLSIITIISLDLDHGNEDNFFVRAAVLLSLVMKVVLCLSLAGTHSFSRGPVFSMVTFLIAADTLSFAPYLPFLVLPTVVFLYVLITITMLGSLDLAQIVAFSEFIQRAQFFRYVGPVLQGARVCAAIATCFLFFLTVVTSPVHVTLVPHALALAASLLVAISIAGETLQSPLLTRVSERGMLHLHLGLFDALRVCARFLRRTVFLHLGTTVLVVFHSVFTALRFAWPAIRSFGRLLAQLFLNRAAVLLFGSVGVITAAYLVCACACACVRVRACLVWRVVWRAHFWSLVLCTHARTHTHTQM
jgi:hypothetical protein